MLNGKFEQPIFIMSLDTELIWGIIHTDADEGSLINDKKHCRKCDKSDGISESR